MSDPVSHPMSYVLCIMYHVYHLQHVIYDADVYSFPLLLATYRCCLAGEPNDITHPQGPLPSLALPALCTSLHVLESRHVRCTVRRTYVCKVCTARSSTAQGCWPPEGGFQEVRSRSTRTRKSGAILPESSSRL